MTRIGSLIKADGNSFRNPRFFHGYSVERRRGGHRFLRVSNNDELRCRKKISKDRREAIDVGLIKGGIHLIENAEWTWSRLKDRKQECHAGHGFFATAQQGDAARFFAGRSGNDFNGCLKEIEVGVEHNISLTSTEETFKKFTKVNSNGLYGLAEEASAFGVQFFEELLNGIFCPGEVCKLSVELCMTLLKRLCFGKSIKIDRSD